MEELITGTKKLGLHLTAGQLEQFEIYYQELIDWNRRVNLTSITSYEDVQKKHFLDSLTLTTAIKFTDGGRGTDAIDIGSGAGLPGIPLKLLFPGIHMVLLEATGKKADFLKHLIIKLGIGETEILTGRAEELAHDERYRENFTLVMSRAVAPLTTLVELTLPFCALGGCFIGQKKGDIDRELTGASAAIEKLGGKLREVKLVPLEVLDDERKLVIIDKIKPTPPRYPRRPGIPSKRPIS